MRAFIIRPFGVKNEIDFDEVARVLISPALEAVGAEGRETLDIVESGNIRTDMFRRLLTADLVVADLSIHNANVFYELGIRHALRAHGAFMLRCAADRFPFDLQTDRYFVYRRDDPAASLPALVEALGRTRDAGAKDAAAKDSPVFVALPGLSEPDHSLLNRVPRDFEEDVAAAAEARRAGDLALLSYEARGFEWEVNGWRAVGRAQRNLKAWTGARETWERVRAVEPGDLEANIQLGTVYERTGDLTKSEGAFRRALQNRAARPADRAEVYALLARNAKTRWRGEWEAAPPGERAAAALRSPHLRDSFENYERAFLEDLNHFYSGLLALASLKVMVELAAALPDEWAEQFDDDDEAARALEKHQAQAAKLAAAVELSLAAAAARLAREGRSPDVWADISAADLRLLTSAAPRRVAAAYRAALADAPDFAADAVRKQLAIYRDLGVLGASLAEVFKVVGEPPPPPAAAEPPPAQRRERVLLFSGHMIDAPGRDKPRFPADREQVARERIRRAVFEEMQAGAGVSIGYAGGASGGDILFHEVCDELGLASRLCLAVPPQEYVGRSVAKAGQQWVERFWRLYDERAARGLMRVLSEAADAAEGREQMPAWLRERSGYNIWQRVNLWMLFNALEEACDPRSGDPNITLIALWDGRTGDGPGGTGHLVEKVERLGAPCHKLLTGELFGL
ncbi:MAG TPA: tetratricopeptide repeat-containing protein [Pyrinomonadaceae bacterium]|jgi:hypothetical protein